MGEWELGPVPGDALMASIIRREVGREIADLIAGYNAGQIRMAAGEMTAQEMRTVQAVQRWWAGAIRHRCGLND